MLAIPQYTLLTGNRCINCHVNVQGGGLRNELGWYAQDGNGLVKPSDIGLGFAEKLLTSNTVKVLDRDLTLGFDFRFQSSRSLVPSPVEGELPSRNNFPMQFALNASYAPTDWMFLEGQYNPGRRPYSSSGQQSWTASVNIQPSLDYPQLRIGYFQPHVGIRYDDHTMLARRDVSGSGTTSYIMAPNYAEWGAELNYYSSLWYSVTAAVYSADNTRDIRFNTSEGTTRSLITSTSRPSTLLRFSLTPRFLDDNINTNVGASVLNNGDFTMINTFAGVGWSDVACLMVEQMSAGNKNERQLRNLSAELMVRIMSPLYVYARGEQGKTTSIINDAEQSVRQTQYTFGAQIFLLPFLEFRPEYRWIDTDTFTVRRWTFQLHMFY
ncbi:MAG: hypothetical protein JNL32_12190 [Candidatus Kapabacteria bacterium]|nr:hypothetical protein [Candidatus Kapabacteria bacterium]